MMYMDGNNDTTIECRDCGLLYDYEVYGRDCVRCEPQVADCHYCDELHLLTHVVEHPRYPEPTAYCNALCEANERLMLARESRVGNAVTTPLQRSWYPANSNNTAEVSHG